MPPTHSIPSRGRYAARKTHRKSRLGCANCKRRCIKCDETKPACANCVRFSIRCIYNQPSPPQMSDSNSSSPSTTTDSLISHLQSIHGATTPGEPDREDALRMDNSASRGNPSPNGLLELQLLHHWSLHTCNTLSCEPSSQTCWRINIPQIGFNFDFVLQGLLAISALHQARLTPDRRGFYCQKAESYWETGLRGASAAMANAKVGSTNALYAFAVTSCFYALAKGPKLGDFLVFTDDGIADWLILFRGVRSVVELSDTKVLEGPLAPLSTCALRHMQRFYKDHDTKDQSTPVEELQRFVDEACGNDPNFSTYSSAIESLLRGFSVVVFEEKSGRGLQAANVEAFVWLYRISDDFVLCLQQRQPLALVIYAYFVVLIKKMDWTWVMEGWADHIISGIYDSLDQEWRVWLQWPIEQIGWVPLF